VQKVVILLTKRDICTKKNKANNNYYANFSKTLLND